MMSSPTTSDPFDNESFERGITPTQWYSLIAALAVSVALVLIWWASQAAPPTVAVQRQIHDLESRWRCTNGHVFQAAGSVLPRKCKTCTATADLEVSYTCTVHGVRDVLVRLEQEDFRERITHVSVHPGIWQQMTKSVHCPKCGRAMTPSSLNPFEDR